MQADKISIARKLATSILKKFITCLLLTKSEPYQAFKQQDTIKMSHYFN